MYYIDGYNVIHKSSLLRPLLDRDFEAAREALIDRVAAYCVTTGHEATIVFDGRGQQKPEIAPHHRGVTNLHVIYSPGHLTADAVIERTIFQRSNRLDHVVVTNDVGLRDLCRGMGSLVMDADNFLQTVRETDQHIDRALNRTKFHLPTTTFIEDALDEESLEKLDALRKELED